MEIPHSEQKLGFVYFFFFPCNREQEIPQSAIKATAVDRLGLLWVFFLFDIHVLLANVYF